MVKIIGGTGFPFILKLRYGEAGKWIAKFFAADVPVMYGDYGTFDVVETVKDYFCIVIKTSAEKIYEMDVGCKIEFVDKITPL